MGDCIFCNIVAGEIPVELVLETDYAIAFRDVQPQAPIHVLVIPKQHYENVQSVAAASPELAGHLIAAAAKVANQEGLENGYRIVANTGADGGQSVGHMHLHVLGGRQLTWPPG